MWWQSHTSQGSSGVLCLPVLTWHLFKCMFRIWCLSVRTNLVASYRAVFRVGRHESCLRAARTWEFCSPGTLLIVEVSNILKIVLSKVKLGQDRTWDSYCRMRGWEKSCKRADAGALNNWVMAEYCWIRAVGMEHADEIFWYVRWSICMVFYTFFSQGK